MHGQPLLGLVQKYNLSSTSERLLSALFFRSLYEGRLGFEYFRISTAEEGIVLEETVRDGTTRKN